MPRLSWHLTPAKATRMSAAVGSGLEIWAPVLTLHGALHSERADEQCFGRPPRPRFHHDDRRSPLRAHARRSRRRSDQDRGARGRYDAHPAADPHRRPGAHHIALGRLDLDHFGAEIDEHAPAVGTGDRRGEIEDAEAVQSTVHPLSPSVGLRAASGLEPRCQGRYLPLPTSGLLLPGLGAKRAAAFRGRLKMAFRNIQAGMATYRGQGGDRGDAYYAHPTNAGPHPGVVVIHDMPGWDEWTCEVARKFAHHGYAAVAPSLYFRVGDGADEQVVAKGRGEGGNPDDQIVGDVAGAVAFLREQSHANGKVGVIGFCSGGRETYLCAGRLCRSIDAAVD